MKKILNILLKGLLCMSAAWWFYSCSDNSETTEQRVHELHVVLGSQQYEDVTPSTRTTTLPTGYEEYIYATALLPITQIQGYMTSANDVQRDEPYVPCLFSHSATEGETPVHTWTSRVALEDGVYYFYGYMPKEEAGTSVSIAPYNDGGGADYAKGAVLTFTNLNAVTAKDVNIIAGVKGYGKGEGNTTVPSDMSERLGKFGYNPSTEGDKLYLLTEHLFSGIEFLIKVNSKYDELRTIKLKSFKLKADKADDDPNSKLLKTVTATVTLIDGVTSPTVVFSNPVYASDGNAAEMSEGEGKLLTTEYQSFMAFMCPASGSVITTNLNYVLETTYDVYDKKGNLVRGNQTARNAIKLENALSAGTKREVKIEVTPTFLYVLSDADLDNPTFKVAN